VEEDLIQQILMQALNGLVWGMIIALVASGLSLIFGIMDVVNFAHGEFYMVGAYLGWLAIKLSHSFWLGLLAALASVALIGMAVEILTLRPIRGRDPLYTLMAMFGLSIFAQQSILALFGPLAKEVKEPVAMKISFFAFEYPLYRLIVVGIAFIIFLFAWLFLQKTKYGVWVRATMQDNVMASAMGIPVKLVYTLSFALGAALAATSGVLVAPIFSVYQTMGLSIIVSAFIVVVIGGLGSLQGAILAAILIGELQTLSSVWISPTYAKVFSFLALIFVLLFRPQGLFSISKRR
jgi:branched-chain amino acid transport system permease protein